MLCYYLAYSSLFIYNGANLNSQFQSVRLSVYLKRLGGKEIFSTPIQDIYFKYLFYTPLTIEHLF